jgi:hypothetical protein
MPHDPSVVGCPVQRALEQELGSREDSSNWTARSRFGSATLVLEREMGRPVPILIERIHYWTPANSSNFPRK